MGLATYLAVVAIDKRYINERARREPVTAGASLAGRKSKYQEIVEIHVLNFMRRSKKLFMHIECLWNTIVGSCSNIKCSQSTPVLLCSYLEVVSRKE